MGIASIFGAATTPVLAWTAPPSVVGDFNLFVVYAGLMTVACSLGQDQAYLRFFHDVEDPRDLLLRTMLPALAAVATISVLIGVLHVSVSRLAFGHADASVAFALASGAVVGILYRFATVHIRMSARAGPLFVNQVLPKCILLSAIAFAIAEGVEPTLALLGWLFVLGNSSAVVVWLIPLRRTRAAETHAREPTPPLRQLAGYGIPLMGSALAFWLMGAAGALGLKVFGSTSELALYAVALSFALPATLAQLVLASVWAPAVFKWSSEEARQRVPKVQLLSSAAALLAFAVLGFCSWFVGLLVPPSYRGVEFLVPVAMASPLMYAMSELTAVGLNLSRRTWMMGLASAISAAVAAGLVVPLADQSGAGGALAAVMVANMVMLILRTEFAARAWAHVPRAHVYGTTVLIAMAALVSASVGPRLGAGVLVMWGAIACVGVGWLALLLKQVVGDYSRITSGVGGFD